MQRITLCQVCCYKENIDPEEVFEDHGGDFAVEWSPKMRPSLVAAHKAAGGVQNGSLSTKPGSENERAMTWYVSEHKCLRHQNGNLDPYMVPSSVSLDSPAWCCGAHLQLTGSLHYARRCHKRAQQDREEADRMAGP